MARDEAVEHSPWTRFRHAAAALKARRPLWIAIQVFVVAALLGAMAWAVRGAWDDALPRLRDAKPLELAVALLVLTAYYLLFVVGWLWILRAYGVRTPYRTALQAEMVSMLAKYIPGGVWTPAARVVALRRAGVDNTPLVLASVLLEAGLSAVAGVLVFVVSLATVGSVDAPLLPLVLFGLVILVLMHPRVFGPVAARLLRPFGSVDLPPLRWRTLVGLLVYYSFTWVIGGAALLFLLRSLGGDPAWSTIAYLGGISAVGAIVSVLAVFAPSGLGVREASMYGLLLAVVPSGVALGATVLNRLAITIVEAALLFAGGLFWRLRRAFARQ